MLLISRDKDHHRVVTTETYSSSAGHTTASGDRQNKEGVLERDLLSQQRKETGIVQPSQHSVQTTSFMTSLTEASESRRGEKESAGHVQNMIDAMRSQASQHAGNEKQEDENGEMSLGELLKGSEVKATPKVEKELSFGDLLKSGVKQIPSQPKELSFADLLKKSEAKSIPKVEKDASAGEVKKEVKVKPAPKASEKLSLGELLKKGEAKSAPEVEKESSFADLLKKEVKVKAAPKASEELTLGDLVKEGVKVQTAPPKQAKELSFADLLKGAEEKANVPEKEQSFGDLLKVAKPASKESNNLNPASKESNNNPALKESREAKNTNQAKLRSEEEANRVMEEELRAKQQQAQEREKARLREEALLREKEEEERRKMVSDIRRRNEERKMKRLGKRYKRSRGAKKRTRRTGARVIEEMERQEDERELPIEEMFKYPAGYGRKNRSEAIDFYKFGWVDAFFRVRTRLGKIDPLPPHVIRRLRRR